MGHLVRRLNSIRSTALDPTALLSLHPLYMTYLSYDRPLYLEQNLRVLTRHNGVSGSRSLFLLWHANGKDSINHGSAICPDDDIPTTPESYTKLLCRT